MPWQPVASNKCPPKISQHMLSWTTSAYLSLFGYFLQLEPVSTSDDRGERSFVSFHGKRNVHSREKFDITITPRGTAPGNSLPKNHWSVQNVARVLLSSAPYLHSDSCSLDNQVTDCQFYVFFCVRQTNQSAPY